MTDIHRHDRPSRGKRSTARLERKPGRALRLVAWLATIACLCLAALPSRAATASGRHTSARPKRAQFVLLIDDSRSMSRSHGARSASDPDRLSVFAASALIGLLDDEDSATVVRMNGAVAGETPPPIQPLADNRAQLEALLSLEGTLAEYDGGETPCRSSLEATKTVLNEAHEEGVSQVLLFLTDGACSSRARDEDVDVDAFLAGLESHEEGRFQFHLLSFENPSGLKSLVALTELTDGSWSMVDAHDPTGILDPFAKAISKSQGYESDLIGPGSARIPAYMGATTVRLFAVAPGKSPDLKIRIRAGTDKGRAPGTLRSIRSGSHQYDGGQPYRFAVAQYEPGEVKALVEVGGASGNWKIVALPEYRIYAHPEIRAGSCSERGDEVSAVEIGARVCATVQIVNDAGTVLPKDFLKEDAEATFTHTDPSGRSEPLSATLNGDGESLGFGFELTDLGVGSHELRGQVTIPMPDGRKITLLAPARTVRASSQVAWFDPPRLPVDPNPVEVFRPGTKKTARVSLDGPFSPTKATLKISGIDDRFGSCLRFRLNDVEQGGTVKMTSTAEYGLSLEALPYCGPDSFDEVLKPKLHLEVDDDSALATGPTLDLELRVVNEIEVPETVAVEVNGGETQDIEIPLSSNLDGEANFRVTIQDPSGSESWPASEHLRLGFADPEGDGLLTYEGNGPVEERQWAMTSKGGSPLRLRAMSDVCCTEGTYHTEILLDIEEENAAPIIIPIEITVTSAGFWACWGSTVIRGLIALGLLLLAFYVYQAHRSAHFLTKTRWAPVSRRFWPLVYTRSRRPDRAEHHDGKEIDRRFRKALRFGPRLRKFLSTKWFLLGLPNRTYHEYVRLGLDTDPAEDEPRITTCMLYGEVRHKGASSSKRPGLYVEAVRGGTRVFAILDREDESVTGHTLHNPQPDAQPTEEKRPWVHTFTDRQDLVTTGKPRPGGAAGWRYQS